MQEYIPLRTWKVGLGSAAVEMGAYAYTIRDDNDHDQILYAGITLCPVATAPDQLKSLSDADPVTRDLSEDRGTAVAIGGGLEHPNDLTPAQIETAQQFVQKFKPYLEPALASLGTAHQGEILYKNPASMLDETDYDRDTSNAVHIQFPSDVAKPTVIKAMELTLATAMVFVKHGAYQTQRTETESVDSMMQEFTEKAIDFTPPPSSPPPAKPFSKADTMANLFKLLKDEFPGDDKKTEGKRNKVFEFVRDALDAQAKTLQQPPAAPASYSVPPPKNPAYPPPAYPTYYPPGPYGAPQQPGYGPGPSMPGYPWYMSPQPPYNMPYTYPPAGYPPVPSNDPPSPSFAPPPPSEHFTPPGPGDTFAYHLPVPDFKESERIEGLLNEHFPGARYTAARKTCVDQISMRKLPDLPKEIERIESILADHFHGIRFADARKRCATEIASGRMPGQEPPSVPTR